MTAFNFLLVGLVGLPWMLGASLGPLVSLNAWVCSAALLACALWVHPRAAMWRSGLVIAALLSVAIAAAQYTGLAGRLAPWVSASDSMEAYANLRQRNQFASLTALGLWAVLCSECVAVRRTRALLMVTLCIAVVWLALGNAMSSSRTGAVQWLVLAGMMLLWRKHFSSTARRLMTLALAAYVVWLMTMPWLAQAVGNDSAGLLGRIAAPVESSRLTLWSNTLQLIADQPLLGHGWRSLAYVHYARDFSGIRFMEMPDNAHNLPLHLAVELGLPVALGFCGLVGWLVWKAKPWNETQPARQLAWGVLLMIGIHSLLEYPLWYGPFFMTALICVGVLCGDLWRNWLLAGTESAQSAIILGVRALAVALLAATAFVAFDYHRVSQIYLTPEQRSSWYAADPLGAAKRSVFFQPHAKFAELQITPLTRESAPRVLELSSELIEWSPEPRIIENLIESATMMELDDLAMFHLQRYRVAYPAAYAGWHARWRLAPAAK